MYADVLVTRRFIPESARWLLGRGRTKEATQLITKVAAINKRTVPESLLEKVLSFTANFVSQHDMGVKAKTLSQNLLY